MAGVPNEAQQRNEERVDTHELGRVRWDLARAENVALCAIAQVFLPVHHAVGMTTSLVLEYRNRIKAPLGCTVVNSVMVKQVGVCVCVYTQN